MSQLVVLAYSGGVDTSAIVPWLKEHYDARVLCYDPGGGAGDSAPPAARRVAEGRGARARRFRGGARTPAR